MENTRRSSKVRGLWYMHLMLVVFWPISILEYIRIDREIKRNGQEWDWRVQTLYWLTAPCVILIMTGMWIATFYFLRYV